MNLLGSNNHDMSTALNVLVSSAARSTGSNSASTR